MIIMNSIVSKEMLEDINSTSIHLMWWTKIYTINPFCIYYFGPFEEENNAQNSNFGYVEDLENEGTKVVFVKLKYLIPEKLTVEFKNLSHVQWLHELMQDSLMLKLPVMADS
jgi:Domain of unknown function (DUF1816)